MANDEYIAEAVNRHCFGVHDHIQSMSGRANSCEKVSPTRSSGGWADFGGAGVVVAMMVIKSSETEAVDCR